MAGVLLTCAQLFPISCPHKEAVMGVCRHRKEEAESMRRSARRERAGHTGFNAVTGKLQE